MQADRDIVHIAGAAGRLLGALDYGAARKEHALRASLTYPCNAAGKVPITRGVIHGLEHTSGRAITAEQDAVY